MAIHEGKLVLISTNTEHGIKDYKSINKRGAMLGKINDDSRSPKDNVLNKISNRTKTF